MKHGRIGGNGYSPARGSSLGVIVKEGFHQSQDVLANGLLQSLSLALIGGIDTADDVGTKGALPACRRRRGTIRPSVRSTRAAAMVVVPMSMAMPQHGWPTKPNLVPHLLEGPGLKSPAVREGARRSSFLPSFQPDRPVASLRAIDCRKKTFRSAGVTASFPATTRTRHFPQRPLPPQGMERSVPWA